MSLLPVLEAIDRTTGYVELLRDHPLVSPSRLQKCEAILADIESFLDELLRTPIPRYANDLRPCVARVLQNIAKTEWQIASTGGKELSVSGSLQLRTAETALDALRFELDMLTDALLKTNDDAGGYVN